MRVRAARIERARKTTTIAGLARIVIDDPANLHRPPGSWYQHGLSFAEGARGKQHTLHNRSMLESLGQSTVGEIADVRCRVPGAADGAELFRIVSATGTLEPNSAYAYVMMADFFGETCVIAEIDGDAAGCIIGFRPPRTPRALFVWQIGVLAHARRRGIARRMLDDVLARPGNRDIEELRTTVDTGNAASEGMFRSFAAARGARLEEIGGYPADLFPCAHEAERMFRITGL